MENTKFKGIPEPTEEELKEIDNEVPDFDLDETTTFYELWLLGNDKDDMATDFEALIDDGYTDLAEIKKAFEFVTDEENFKQFVELNKLEIPKEVEHLYVRIEACTENGDEIVCEDIVQEQEIKFSKN